MKIHRLSAQFWKHRWKSLNESEIQTAFGNAIASAVLVGCSSNKVKEAKPNPLPKLTESNKSLVPVFSRSVSSTNKADPLRLQLDASEGVVFTLDPKGEVAAYRGKQRLWEKKLVNWA